jgi:hypothetical protein
VPASSNPHHPPPSLPLFPSPSPFPASPSLDILAQPPNTLAVSLPHHHTAHEDLNGPDTLQRHLALTRSLVQAERRAQLVLRHSFRVIDLVAEDDKGRVLELLHGEKGVELGFGLVEALVVLCVDEEDDARDFGDWWERVLVNIRGRGGRGEVWLQ